MPQVTGVLETALYVANLSRAREFYERVFDFRPMAADERFCAYSVADRQVLLLFERGKSLQPMPTSGGVIPPHDGSGEQHLAFSCARDELTNWDVRLVAEHVPIESRVDWERGGTSIYFRDPDGNLLELATPGIWPIY
ncbi:MAG: VOC family protein [Pirellulales bacterium]|nr:VOC family protein [Pirellulales bacterium]